MSRASLWGFALCAAAALTAGMPAGAWAAGELTQLPGATGCISETGQEGCAKGRALEGVYTVAVTTDGRTAYATSFDSDAIAIFARDPKTGALTQKSGVEGCISLSGGEGCRKGTALDGARGIARSPDGRNVYVASPESDAIAVFARNPKTGALRQLPGKGGCISRRGKGGCAKGRGLDYASAITTSADGKDVYVAADISNAVSVFRRNPRTGALTQLPGRAGCISASGREGCRRGRGLDGAFFVSKTPDGQNVYTASFNSNAVAIFRRDARTGALRQLAGRAGCASQGGAGGCARARGLLGAEVVVATPDGRNAYVVSSPQSEVQQRRSEAISIFTRNPRSGALEQKSGTSGCVSTPFGEKGCDHARALEGPEAATVSPDGKSIYVGATGSDAVDVFARNPRTGALAQAPGVGGCISQSGAEGCEEGRALDGVITLSPSPDGRNLYTASIGSDAVAVFGREP